MRNPPQHCHFAAGFCQQWQILDAWYSGLQKLAALSMAFVPSCIELLLLGIVRNAMSPLWNALFVLTSCMHHLTQQARYTS